MPARRSDVPMSAVGQHLAAGTRVLIPSLPIGWLIANFAIARGVYHGEDHDEFGVSGTKHFRVEESGNLAGVGKITIDSAM